MSCSAVTKRFGQTHEFTASVPLQDSLSVLLRIATPGFKALDNRLLFEDFCLQGGIDPGSCPNGHGLRCLEFGSYRFQLELLLLEATFEDRDSQASCFCGSPKNVSIVLVFGAMRIETGKLSLKSPDFSLLLGSVISQSRNLAFLSLDCLTIFVTC
jgi:hypothetical protein